MQRKKRIESILEEYFSEYIYKVDHTSLKHRGHNNFSGNDETHFSITLNSKKKIRENRLLIHRKINNLLKKEFNLGLHALEIKVLD